MLSERDYEIHQIQEFTVSKDHPLTMRSQRITILKLHANKVPLLLHKLSRGCIYNLKQNRRTNKPTNQLTNQSIKD